MDKILQRVSEHDQTISVTNDGATILRSIHIDNAAAKVLVDIAKVQDDEVGDGTTSVAVLCGELLRQAEDLVAQRIHPQTIAAGWRLARNYARKALEEAAIDNSNDSEKFRRDLFLIARTTLSSKVVTHEKDYFANLAVDAVLRLKVCNIENVAPRINDAPCVPTILSFLLFSGIRKLRSYPDSQKVWGVTK
jgi:T-complex protein 1 subunit beta